MEIQKLSNTDPTTSTKEQSTCAPEQVGLVAGTALVNLPADILVYIISFEPTLLPAILMTSKQFSVLWSSMFDTTFTNAHKQPTTQEILGLFKDPSIRSVWGRDVAKARCEWAQVPFPLHMEICPYRREYKVTFAAAKANGEKWLQEVEQFKLDLDDEQACAIKLIEILNGVTNIIQFSKEPVHYENQFQIQTALRIFSGHFSIDGLRENLQNHSQFSELIEVLYHCHCNGHKVKIDHLIAWFLTTGITMERMIYMLSHKIFRDTCNQFNCSMILSLINGYASKGPYVEHYIDRLGQRKDQQILEIACRSNLLDDPMSILYILFKSDDIEAAINSGEIQVQDIFDLFKRDDPFSIHASAFNAIFEKIPKPSAKLIAKLLSITNRDDSLLLKTLKTRIDLWYVQVMVDSGLTDSEKGNIFFEFARNDFHRLCLVYQVGYLLKDSRTRDRVENDPTFFDELVNVVLEMHNQPIEAWVAIMQERYKSQLEDREPGLSTKDPNEPDTLWCIRKYVPTDLGEYAMEKIKKFIENQMH